MTIRDIFNDMSYGPAPESAAEAVAWLDTHSGRFGHFIDGAFTQAGRNLFHQQSGHGRASGRGHPRVCRRCRCRRRGRASRPAQMGPTGGPRAGAAPLCAGAARPEARPPARGARNARQRQADPRNPRHRHAAGRAPLLPSRRLAQLLPAELPDMAPLGVCGAIIPWNFPAADAGLEGRPGTGRRQHGGAEAGRVHPADRAAASPRSAARPVCPRAWSTSSPAMARPARPLVDHPDVDKIAFTGSTDVGRTIREATAGHRQGADARTGRQVALHRVRRRRSRQRRRGSRRCDLVQPGPGLLRGLAPSGAGGHRRPLSRQAAGAAWTACASAIRSTSPSTSARSSTRCNSSTITGWWTRAAEGEVYRAAPRCPDQAASTRRP